MNLNKTQKRIISLLFLNKAASKKQLALQMNLSQAALTLSSKPLADKGILSLEGKKATGKVGRNEELLSLNKDYGYFLGVDAKPTSFTLTEMDLSGNLLLEEKFFTDNELFSRIKKIVDEKNILGVCVTYRKQLSSLQQQKLFDLLLPLKIPNISFVNNVSALANIYSFLHEEEPNFLLIKYGPGLGSCIYANGSPIMEKNGSRSEIGHAYLTNGKRLEDIVSFRTLLGKDVDESEGAEILFEKKDKLDTAIKNIALCLVDADALLALNRIVFAGILLSNQTVNKQILSEIKKYEKDFPVEKILTYPNYSLINKKKSCLQALLNWIH